MTKIQISLLGIVILSGIVSYAKAGNIITNPSFEVNTTGWDLDADYTSTTTQAHDGTKSVAQVSASAFANFNTHNDSVGLDVRTNALYQLTFWLKVTSLTGNMTHIQINHDNAFGTNYLDNALPNTSGVWQQVTKTFNSGGFGKVWIRFYNNNGAVNAFYDEFILTEMVPNEAIIKSGSANLPTKIIKSGTNIIKGQ